MKRLLNSIIIVFVFAFIVSCEENISSQAVKKQLPSSIMQNRPDDLVFKNYVNNIDWTDVVGYISIMKYNHNTYNNGQTTSGSGFDVFARTFDNDQESLLSENYISINGVALEEIGEGNYQLNNSTLPTNFVINYGTGTNHITLENRNGQEVLNSDVMIQAPVTITNISAMQNVPLFQNFQVNYTPVADNCIVYTTLLKNSSNTSVLNLGTNDKGIGQGYFSNNGNVTYSSTNLVYALVPGLFDLKIMKEEIKILTRTDGKKLAVFVQTIDEKTVTLVQ